MKYIVDNCKILYTQSSVYNTIIYFNDELDDDDKVYLHINDDKIEMKNDTELGDNYYVCNIKYKTLGLYLAKIYINDDYDNEIVIKNIVSLPENQYKIISKA